MKRIITSLALIPVRVIGNLPLPLARLITRPLGAPMRWLMGRRRRIAERNLKLCFPELDAAGRRRLLKRHFRNLGEAVGEIAVAWCRPRQLHDASGEVVGLENLPTGAGVILVTGHATCLELGARVLGEHLRPEIRARSKAIYRPLRNPELERFQNAGRARYSAGRIARDDLRAMVRHLRAGGVLWYAPDQDFGPDRSVFAPFFGIATATATGLLDLARLGRAGVVPMYPVKDEATGRVTVHLEPALEAFPSRNPVDDLARINRFLEHYIRIAPAQYWWLHRRFKTRPDGEPDPYPDD